MRKLGEWIEFMENTEQSREFQKMDLLLKHSISDQQVLDNLRRLRRAVRASDPAQTIEIALANPKFMKRFHNKIMESIAVLATETSQVPSTKKALEARRESKEIHAIAHEDLLPSRGSCNTE